MLRFFRTAVQRLTRFHPAARRAVPLPELSFLIKMVVIRQFVLFYACLDHPLYGGLYRCAKCGWNRYSIFAIIDNLSELWVCKRFTHCITSNLMLEILKHDKIWATNCISVPQSKFWGHVPSDSHVLRPC